MVRTTLITNYELILVIMIVRYNHPMPKFHLTRYFWVYFAKPRITFMKELQEDSEKLQKTGGIAATSVILGVMVEILAICIPLVSSPF